MTNEEVEEKKRNVYQCRVSGQKIMIDHFCDAIDLAEHFEAQAKVERQRAVKESVNAIKIIINFMCSP